MDITLRPVTQAELDDFRRATGVAFGNIGGRRRLRVGARARRRALAGRLRRHRDRRHRRRAVVRADRPGACARADGRGDHGGRPPHAPPPGPARADDGRAARRRRRPVRAAGRAHRERDRDLRTVRVRPRHVLVASGRSGRKARRSSGRAPPAGSSGSSIPPPRSPSFPRSTTRARKLHVGEVTRSTQWFEQTFGNRPDGKPRRTFTVVHESDDGHADGFARYRVKDDWPGGIAANTVEVVRPVRRSTPRSRPGSGSSSSTSTSSRPCGASTGRWTNRCGGGSPLPAVSRSTR